MSIVTNTGPLIALAKIDQLSLLEQMRLEGYWLSDALLELATKLAGESP